MKDTKDTFDDVKRDKKDGKSVLFATSDTHKNRYELNTDSTCMPTISKDTRILTLYSLNGTLLTYHGKQEPRTFYSFLLREITEIKMLNGEL